MIRFLMHKWERQLLLRDKNRVSLPFDWGLEFLEPANSDGQQPRAVIHRYNRSAIEASDDFFSPTPLQGEVFKDNRLSFPSSVESPYPPNNIAGGIFFPASKDSDRAVVVLPQWNANERGHVALCRLLARLGLSAFRLTLPYHENRNPHGPRADYMISANIGRTIQAIRQAVLDTRNVADWLLRNGYKRLGIIGTSIGSCIAFLAFVHDERFRVGVFNHVSSFFGDVVWKGISTKHIRKAIEGFLTQEELHDAWAVISPNSYVSRLQTGSPRKTLMISARYDLTFPPDLAQLLFNEHERWSIPYDVAHLPCGHYSSGLTPFKHLDGFLIGKYFRKYL